MHRSDASLPVVGLGCCRRLPLDGLCDSEIEHLADPAVGQLYIGTTPPMSAIASAVINRLMPRYPRMVFHLIAESVPILMLELRRRNIELAIARMVAPASTTDGLAAAASNSVI